MKNQANIVGAKINGNSMSDIKLFNLKNRQEYKKEKNTKIDIKKIVEKNSFDLLGVTVIAKDVVVTDNQTEVIDTLGYDENYRLVIIEYRHGKFSNLIKKGLVIIDYIRKFPAKVKVMLAGYENKNFKCNDLDLNPRLIIIGDDFNSYDEFAIRQMPYEIDLIKHQLFGENIIALEKVYQSTKEIIINKKLIVNSYFATIHNFILSLGDEVVATGNNYYTSYRKIRNFVYLIFQEQLIAKVKVKGEYKDYKVKSKVDCDKVIKIIEQSYDEE